jgi:hypothetical protein
MWKQQPRMRILAATLGLALVLTTVLLMAAHYFAGRDRPPVKEEPSEPFVRVIDPKTAPVDVQMAAEKLRTSQVGYAIVHPDRTYLIISTGSDDFTVSVDRAEAQPSFSTPSLVDIHFRLDRAGERLLIATTPLTVPVEYQFDVDGHYAAIPTLHNPHNLPLTYLDAASRFAVLAPAEGQLISGRTLHVEGYAQVFEAQFTVTVMSDTGRVLGQKAVMAAAGAPSWGSFAADIPIDTRDLPATGFVIFAEEMTEARFVIPVSFERPPQLG